MKKHNSKQKELAPTRTEIKKIALEGDFELLKSLAEKYPHDVNARVIANIAKENNSYRLINFMVSNFPAEINNEIALMFLEFGVMKEFIKDQLNSLAVDSYKIYVWDNNWGKLGATEVETFARDKEGAELAAARFCIRYSEEDVYVIRTSPEFGKFSSVVIHHCCEKMRFDFDRRNNKVTIF